MSGAPRKAAGWVRAVIDYAAPAAFLIGFVLTRDVVQATWALVIGSAVGLAIGFATERRVAPMPLVAGAFAVIFGGLTLIFHDPQFVMMKPTFAGVAFCLALFAGLAFRRNPLKALFGDALHLSDQAWRTLTWRYGLYFLATAVLNEIVWRNWPQQWPYFKFPGLALLAVAFSLTQAPLMMRHRQETPSAED